jgi:hypothetical protein
MNTAWPFNPDWSDIEAEVWWQVRELTPDTPKADTLKRLAALAPVLAKLGNLETAALLEELRERLKLRAVDLSELKSDIKAARKAQKSNGKKVKGKTLDVKDLEEGFRLHPAIDFLGEAMTIGFRVSLTDNETGLLLIISDAQGVRAEVNPETVEIGERVYQVMENTVPPFVQDVWNLDRLKAFLEHPTRPQELYKVLVGAFKKYLDLPEPAYGLLAAWAVGTYFAHLFTAFPFLHFLGPKESGKSKSLEALRYVCLNAWKGRDITPAALGDTTDGQRGTLLLDQAEKMNNDKESSNLIGLLADSYKKAGGQRRVLDTSGKTRKVLEFSTYGPKAFASTKNIDPDLRDRCIKIPMTRTRRRLPDLEGWEPVWKELKDKLYRFTLASFKNVRQNYEANPGDGTRIGELWRPLLALLLTLEIEGGEVEVIRTLFMEAAQEGRHEPTGWECTLLEVLREEAQTHQNKFEMAVSEILKAMNIGGDKKPGNKWIGDTLSRYHLHQFQRRVNIKVEGKRSKETAYQFDPARVKELCEIYLRDTPPDDLSHLSTGDNSNDSKWFEVTRENQGTRPHLSPMSPDDKDGGDIPGPAPIDGCVPKELYENTKELVERTGGQAKTGGMAENNSHLFPGADVDPLGGEL